MASVLPTVSVDAPTQSKAEKLYKGLKTESLNQTYADLADDEGYKRSIYEDTREIAENVRRARVALVDISASLVKFDKANYKDKSGKAVGPLGPDHSKNIRQFDDLLQMTLEQSTNATTFLKSMNAVLGDVQPPDGQDLKAELEQFLRISNHKTNESENSSGMAKKLKDGLKTLSDQIASVSSNSTASNKDLDTLKAEVEKSQKTLNGYFAATQVNNIGGAIGYALFTSDPNTGTKFSDALWSSAVYQGEGNPGDLPPPSAALQKLREVQRNLEDKQNELVAAQSGSGDLKEVNRALAEANSSIDSIYSALNILASFWTILNKELQDLDKGVKADIGNGGTISNEKLKQLQMTRDVYKTYIFYLETFIEQVRSA